MADEVLNNGYEIPDITKPKAMDMTLSKPPWPQTAPLAKPKAKAKKSKSASLRLVSTEAGKTPELMVTGSLGEGEILEAAPVTSALVKQETALIQDGARQMINMPKVEEILAAAVAPLEPDFTSLPPTKVAFHTDMGKLVCSYPVVVVAPHCIVLGQREDAATLFEPKLCEHLSLEIEGELFDVAHIGLTFELFGLNLFVFPARPE